MLAVAAFANFGSKLYNIFVQILSQNLQQIYYLGFDLLHRGNDNIICVKNVFIKYKVRLVPET